MSDNFEEDLTSMVICKYDKKVLCATSEGVINIFSWDWFGDCNDRIIGHPGSIDTMIKYDEDTIITGSEDGLIRAVSVLPNKIIAILGDPTEQNDGGEVFHIQKVALSHDKCWLASCSLDDIVKIIDVTSLGQRMKEQFDEEAYEIDIRENPRVNRKKKKSKKTGEDGDMDMGEESKGSDDSDDWESGSDDSDDDSDDSDDSDMEMDKPTKKDKKLNPKSNNVQKSLN